MSFATPFFAHIIASVNASLLHLVLKLLYKTKRKGTLGTHDNQGLALYSESQPPLKII